MAEASPQQPVVQMAAIGIEGRAARAEPAHDHGRHICQGQRQDQQRQQQAHPRDPLGRPDDADRRQGKPKEIGAAIAHEDAGGIEIVAQKAEAGTGQGGGQ